jgi:hypothetical protein
MSVLSAFWLVILAALASYGVVRVVVSIARALGAILERRIVRRDAK